MTVTKWIFCCLIAVIALSSCKAEIEGDPDRFKKGIFEIPASESFGKTTIIRKDSLQICLLLGYSTCFKISYPAFNKSKSFFISLTSDSIISFTNSSKSYSGTHPNFSFALVGSPINKSTSVGRK